MQAASPIPDRERRIEASIGVLEATQLADRRIDPEHPAYVGLQAVRERLERQAHEVAIGRGARDRVTPQQQGRCARRAPGTGASECRVAQHQRRDPARTASRRDPR